MTKADTAKILSMISEMYPSFRKDRNPEITLSVWQRIFQDQPYALVENALMAYIASDVKGFPPQPGALNAFINQAAASLEPSETEAWRMVIRAARRGLYNSHEEFAKLPPSIQRIVGSPEQIYEWAGMSVEDMNTVVASHFKRAYRNYLEHAGDFFRLPGALQNALIASSEDRLSSREGF